MMEEKQRRSHGVLAAEDRTGRIFLGGSGQARCQRRALDGSSQFQSKTESQGHEEGRARLFLSHGQGEAGGRDRRGDTRSLSRSHRHGWYICGGGREKRRPAAAPGDARGRQGEPATEGYGARQICAALSTAGNLRRMEGRLLDGRSAGARHPPGAGVQGSTASMKFANINYLAVLVAAVVAWLAGAVWYTAFSRT